MVMIVIEGVLLCLFKLLYIWVSWVCGGAGEKRSVLRKSLTQTGPRTHWTSLGEIFLWMKKEKISPPPLLNLFWKHATKASPKKKWHNFAATYFPWIHTKKASQKTIPKNHPHESLLRLKVLVSITWESDSYPLENQRISPENWLEDDAFPFKNGPLQNSSPTVANCPSDQVQHIGHGTGPWFYDIFRRPW